MKKWLYGFALTFTMCLGADQASAVYLDSHAEFLKDYKYEGYYGQDYNDYGIVYAKYEDFDKSGLKDLYYVVLPEGEYYYKEYLYLNDELVLKEEFFGPSAGLSGTNSLNFAFYNGKVYRGFPAYTRAWEGGGMQIMQLQGKKFKQIANYYFIDDDPEDIAPTKYHINNKAVSKAAYNKEAAKYKNIPWVNIIIGGAGDNYGYHNSKAAVEAVYKKIVADEEKFKNTPFVDITPNSELATALNRLVDANAVSQSSLFFSPNKSLTRGQASKMITEAFNLYGGYANIEYTDVKESSDYYDYISKLKGHGIMNGVSETKFGINAPLTRSQIAAIIVRALELPPVTKNHTFTDIQNATTQDNVNRLAEAGIISTSTTKFKPSHPVTRGQMALFLYRAIQYQEQSNNEE